MWKEILDIGPLCHERFIDLNNVPEITDLGIELAGSSNLAGEYCVARPNPSSHTLFYTLSGEGLLKTSTNQYALTPNTLAVLPARSPFYVEINDTHWDIFWINLSDIAKWQFINHNSNSVITNLNLEALHHALELLYREKNSELRQGVLPIIEYYLSNTLNRAEQRTDNYRLSNLFNNIEKQLHFTWTIENMCEQVHYSPPHLHRLCLKQFGRSPIQQLIYLRVKRAKYLLKNTNWPIAQIANYVGYQQIFTFSKRFKQSEGISPREYRK